MRYIQLAILVAIFLTGCASVKLSQTQIDIKDSFKVSSHYKSKSNSSVDVVSSTQSKTLDRLIEESGVEVDATEYDGYNIEHYTVTYNGPYWLESYQVLSSCNKNGCKYKFLYMQGVYA